MLCAGGSKDKAVTVQTIVSVQSGKVGGAVGSER